MFAARRLFSTTARLRTVRLEPPAHLDDKEAHVFKKLTEALGPSKLEVSARTHHAKQQHLTCDAGQGRVWRMRVHVCD